MQDPTVCISYGGGSSVVGAPLQNLGKFVYPTLPVSFGGDTKSCCRFNRVSMPGEVKDPMGGGGGGKCITSRGLNTEVNHSCISTRMGCLEYTYLRPTT